MIGAGDDTNGVFDASFQKRIRFRTTTGNAPLGQGAVRHIITVQYSTR